MPRYDQWRRLTGDSNRPDLLDLGKRLLGFLAEQRALSGVKSMSIERQAPDGSIVRARFVGDLPDIQVQEARPASAVSYDLFDGFSIRPTLTSQANFGVNAYGTFAYENAGNHIEVLLARVANTPNAKALSAYWHSEPYKPNDDAPARYFGGIFGDDGLLHTGNLDWQGKAGVLHFFGPVNRISDPLEYYGQQVFHNGAVLLDVYDVEIAALDGDHGWCVMGAALYGPGHAVELRFIAGKEVADSGLAFRMHAMRVPLKSASTDPATAAVPLRYHPRLTPQLDDDDKIIFDVLAEYTVPHGTYSGFIPPMHFNQSGNEARGIFANNNDDGNLSALSEVVCAFTLESSGDLVAAFTPTDLATTELTSTETVATTGSVSLATGTIYNETDGLPFPARTSVTGGDVPVLAETTSYVTRDAANDDFCKIAVDYRGDVPVYLETSRRTGVLSHDVSFTRSASGSGNVKWNTLIEDWGEGTPPASGSATVSSTGTRTEDFASTIKTDWWQAEDTYQRDRADTYSTVGTAADVGNGTMVGTSGFSDTTATVTHRIAYLDLRHRIVVYQREDVTDAITSSSVIDYGLAGGDPTGGTDTEATTDHARQVRVMLDCNGVEVESDLVVDESSLTPVSTHTDFTNTPIFRAYTLFLLHVPTDVQAADFTSEATTTDTDVEPPQVEWDYWDKREDYAYNPGPNWNIGCWAVSRNLLAYSYAIGGAQTTSAPGDDTAAKFKHGLYDMSTNASVTSVDFHGLTYDDDSLYVRFHPIFAISPFFAKRIG